MQVKISGDGTEADCNFTVPTLTAWERSDSLPVNLVYYSALQLLMLRLYRIAQLETSCGSCR